jgi:hypothetical protein
VGLINHVAKACFVQWLVNERIHTVVRAKGESVGLSVRIVAALEAEWGVLPVKERGFAPRTFNKGPEMANRTTGNHESMNQKSHRGLGLQTEIWRGTGAHVRKGKIKLSLCLAD